MFMQYEVPKKTEEWVPAMMQGNVTAGDFEVVDKAEGSSTNGEPISDELVQQLQELLKNAFLGGAV